MKSRPSSSPKDIISITPDPHSPDQFVLHLDLCEPTYRKLMKAHALRQEMDPTCDLASTIEEVVKVMVELLESRESA